MIVKRCTQGLLMGIFIPLLFHGANSQEFPDVAQKLGINISVEKSPATDAIEKPNQRQVREADSGTEEMTQFDFDQSNESYSEFGYDSENNMVMFQFDNDHDTDQRSDSYAEITIAFDQNFTVCFAFMIDALTADYTGYTKVFHWQSDGGSKDMIMIKANMSSGNISIGGIDVYAEPFALSTWKQICYSSTATLVMNGRKVYNRNASQTFLGKTTLFFGLIDKGPLAQMKITQVNVFSPALSVECMQSITDRDKHQVCFEPGNIFDWKSNTCMGEKVDWTYSGKTDVKEMEAGENLCSSSIRNFDYFTRVIDVNILSWFSVSKFVGCMVVVILGRFF